ncbi:MAG: RagB/SusD family nutrient uptake outer membrane protein [Bacteroidales bacterium]|nr:RagB/SusD family nutrient uptake outer membrane protein [Bacteroidales bacterium]
MKKIIVFGIALLALAACEMDFVPSDSMTSAALKENPNAAVYTTNGIYTLFKDVLPYQGEGEGGANDNRYVRHFFQIAETRGDNVVISGHSTDPFLGPYCYEEDPKENNLYYTWWIAYKIIYAANANISGMDENSTGEAAHLLGENYFFRAFMHFHMVTLFAMPYSANPNAPGVPLRIGMDYSSTTRASVEDVYKAIISDLKDAIKYMDKAGTPRGNAGYVSANAARLLLSRVYLTRGTDDDLQQCINLCNELEAVAPASVKSVYSKEQLSAYPAATMNADETIWCIIHSFPADFADYWGNATDHNTTPGAMYYATGAEKDGWGEWYWSDELIELFQRYPQDNRFKAYFHYDPKGVLNDGKKMITFPVKDSKAKFCYSGYAKGDELTDNGDGSYTFNYPATGGKSYKATPEMVNGYKHYYLTDATTGAAANLTGDATFGKDGKSEAYMRDNVNDSTGIRSFMYVRYFNTKFSGQGGYMTATSPVFLRWAEVWLNRAEAYARKNMDVQALADVDFIRTRAGLPAEAKFVNTATANARGYASVLDVVLDERRMEFCFEGQRFFDLLRNKKNIDRRYVGYHDFEIIPYNDPKVAMRIPTDEIEAAGISQNNHK